MQFPTAYLPEKVRSAVRFTVVGTTGMFLQTWFFQLFLLALLVPVEIKTGWRYYTAFVMGYLVEMVINYLLLNWYTFGTRPSWKNAGGFLIARAVNLPVQLGLLPLCIALLPYWSNEYISYLVIFIGGCINYVICLLFFKNKKKEHQNSNEQI